MENSAEQSQPRGRPPPEGEKHWIVVADHKKAHVYEKKGKAIERIPNAGARCSHDFPKEGTGREDVFLRELAEWLDTAEREGAFDRLVLIAPASTVDEIRALLGENVDTKVCEALNKEVEHVTEEEIEDRLTEVVWL